MERVAFIAHRGKQVLVEDFSGMCPGEEFEAAIREARALIEAQPGKSVLACVDVAGARFDAETIGTLKDFTARNAPWVKAAAVVGIEGLLSVALSAISRFSGRTFRTFKDRTSALDWLVEQ